MKAINRKQSRYLRSILKKINSSKDDIINNYTTSKMKKNNGLFMCYFRFELNQ